MERRGFTRMTKESKLIKNTAIIAVGNICTKCVGFLMLPLYTTLLTTTEYGVVDIISTYVTLLTVILTLQFEQALFRYLVESRGDEVQQKKNISTTLYIAMGVNTLFALIFVPVLIAVGYQYTWQLIIWSVLACANALLLQIPRGFGDNTKYAIGSFLSGSLNVIFNVLFIVILKLGVNGMLYANIIALGISTIYIICYVKIWKFLSLKWFDKMCLYALSRYALPLIPYTLCWWIIGAADRWCINYFMGDAANGIYSVAHKFPSIFTMVTSIFQTAWAESAAENINAEDRDAYYHKIFDKTLRFYSSGNIGIIACIPLVFGILIKNDFTAAYNYIPILMTSSFLHGINAIYGSIYFAYKKTKEVARTAVASAVIDILINLMFIKKMGLYAASISTFMAYGMAIIIRQIDIQKLVPISINPKYIAVELPVYVLVFIGYYQGTKIQQVGVLLLLVPYCFYQNRNVLTVISRKILFKIRRS